jgi:hypothetical protein
MTKSVLAAFVLSFVCVVTILCGAGSGIAYLLVPEPARRYATATFSFAIPPGWACRRENLEHVCDNGNPPHDSIVIFTMKQRGIQDTFQAYEDHLRGPIPAAGGGGQSEFVSLKRVRIAGADWIEGVRRNSEARNYETTYLTSLTAEIAILFTFSVHEPASADRMRDLHTMADSLVVYQH